MRMSTKGRYGLRVMMELAYRYGQGPTAADLISESQDISANYIHNILNVLQTAGMIQTLRGSKGGYILQHEPANINLLEILTALEGSVSPVECVDHADYCNRMENCAIHDIWSEVTEAMQSVLSNVTLQNLVERQNRKNGSIIK